MEIYYNNYLANLKHNSRFFGFYNFLAIIASFKTKTVTLIKEQQYTPNQTVKQI
jgi:hypothetical protein